MFDNERRIIKLTADSNDTLDKWIILLLKRFKELFNIVLKLMTKEWYILKNIANRRELRKYAQKILQWVKNVSLISLQTQLDIIYNDINFSLKKNDIKFFKIILMILKNFLKQLNNYKYN